MDYYPAMEPQIEEKKRVVLLSPVDELEGCFARKDLKKAKAKIMEIRAGLYKALVPQKDPVFSLLARLENMATPESKGDYRTLMDNLKRRILRLAPN